MAMAFQSFQALLPAPQCLKKLKLLDSKDAYHIRNLSIGISAAAGARSELFERIMKVLLYKGRLLPAGQRWNYQILVNERSFHCVGVDRGKVLRHLPDVVA
jgi:hypothetical protein